MPPDSVTQPEDRGALPDETTAIITPQQSQQNDENLEYIAGKVARSQCILFLGSAIHVPPPPGGEVSVLQREKSAHRRRAFRVPGKKERLPRQGDLEPAKSHAALRVKEISIPARRRDRLRRARRPRAFACPLRARAVELSHRRHDQLRPAL